MNINDILAIIPHRYPMLLVDKVLSIEPKTSILALKNVSINEPYFAGHFPHYPIMPGVLILEALAQASGLLIMHSYELHYKGSDFLFGGVKSVKFKAPVYPGEQLILNSKLLVYKHNIAKFATTAMVGENIIAIAEEITLIYKDNKHESFKQK